MLQFDESQAVFHPEKYGLVEGCFDGQEIDEEVLNWYVQRFKQFKEDNCIDAINAYVHHCTKRTDLNNVTKVAVMQKSIAITYEI